MLRALSEANMELHTPDSLRSIHGLDIGLRRKFRLRRWIAALVARLLEAERRRSDYERLLEMSDRELRDIGISRSDAVAAYYGMRPRPRRGDGPEG